MKKWSTILFLFFFIIIFNLQFIPNNLDEIWNYGFSYAIRLGEIPYKDFNMVLPPLYSYIMAIPLLVANNYLSFVIFHSIIMTGEFYLLYKLFDKKAYLVFLLSLILFPLIYPTYNSFFLFLMIVIVYLEKSKIEKKEYWIGFLIACCFLTKQSVGIFFIIPSIIFRKKNHISLKNRFLGFIIPNILLLIYLFITNTMYSFLDLCFFGLFDFSKNSQGITIPFLLFILILIISIIFLYRNKKDIVQYYLILSYALFLPIFDSLHLFYVIFSFTLLVINNIKKTRLRYELLLYPCLIGILFILGNNRNIFKSSKNDIRHFEYKYISKEKRDYSKKIISFIKENESIIYDDDAYFYRIAADEKIGNLDLLNHGNHGYHGKEKIISFIKENKEKIFLVRKDCINRINEKKTQLEPDGYYYIVKNASKIGNLLDYDLYSFTN